MWHLNRRPVLIPFIIYTQAYFLSFLNPNAPNFFRDFSKSKKFLGFEAKLIIWLILVANNTVRDTSSKLHYLHLWA